MAGRFAPIVHQAPLSHDKTLPASILLNIASHPDRYPRLRAWLSASWVQVLSRSLAAIFGGYALTAAFVAFLALALPMHRSQSVLTAMLLGIVLYACAAMWAFATRSALRAWVGILVPAVVCYAGLRLLQGAGA